MASREPLAVWLYGIQVASLGTDDGERLHLVWTDDGYDRWGSGSRVVSNLLPMNKPATGPHPSRVKAFVDGLLPEGHARTNYAVEAGLRPEDTFGLLARYGRDTAGALVFQALDEPSPVRVGEYRTIDEAEVGQRLRDAHRNVPALDGGRDSSTLAGMQPKITLHRTDDGQWQACLDGAPSTWIVKVAQPLDSPSGDVIDTEVLSLDIARQSGLAAAHAEIHTFGGIRAIAVERYDRRPGPLGVERLHQEDLAQALGLNTQDPLRKFQRGNTMPSLALAADVLRNSGAEPDDLLRLTTINYALGNIDAHAKNISFLRYDDGTADLAPAYDIAMHTHHDDEQHRAALDINGKINYSDIEVEDLVAEGRSWGLPRARADRIVHETLDATHAAAEVVDLADYPGVSARALDTVRRRACVTHAAPAISAPTPARARRGPRQPNSRGGNPGPSRESNAAGPAAANSILSDAEEQT